MPVTNLTNVGCFDSVLESQVNANFAAVAQISPTGQQTFAGPIGASGFALTPIALTGTTDAIPQHVAACYVITNATGVDACTLAAPTAGTDDGKLIYVYSSTAEAHTITATGLFQDGSTTVNTATFAAHAGCGVVLMAYNAKWIVVQQTVGVTMS